MPDENIKKSGADSEMIADDNIYKEEYRKAFATILRAYRDRENGHKILEQYLLKTCCVGGDESE